MTFIDQLRSAGNNSIVNFHEFLLNLKKNTVHAFFEGKTDESFYGSFIRCRIQPKWSLKTYKCGNKDKVYIAHKKISARHCSDIRMMFFVDKDIDDIIPVPRIDHDLIYVTDYYSIENYLVSDEVLERVWGELFRQESGSEVFELIRRKFRAAQDRSYDVMYEIMAWALYHRRAGSRPTLDKVDLAKFISFTDELEVQINQNQLVQNLDGQCGVITPISFDMQSLKKELLKWEGKKVIRGKFELWFFISFINKVKRAVDELNGGKVKVNVSLCSANALDILGPRVTSPRNLDSYLAHQSA